MRWSLLALVPLVCLAGCADNTPRDVPAWPEAAEVERITASVTGAVDGQPGVDEFELPAEFIPDVLRVLSPPEYHRHPPVKYTQEVGRLNIACRDGRVLDVRLIFFGKGPVLFTVQGVPCVRGGPYNDMAPGFNKYLPEVLTLEGVLRDVHSGNRDSARKWLEKLDNSAGREGRDK